MSESKEVLKEDKPKSNEISYGEVTSKNLNLIKLMNLNIFPVQYNQQFYTNLLKTTYFCKLVFHTEALVGGVCCRLEDLKEVPIEASKETPPKLPPHTPYRLYIMTLGVLAPYRRLGIGAFLFFFVIKF